MTTIVRSKKIRTTISITKIVDTKVRKITQRNMVSEKIDKEFDVQNIDSMKQRNKPKIGDEIMGNKNEDNRANQLNPNNDAYYQSRGYSSKADYENQQAEEEDWDEDGEDEDEDYSDDVDEDEWDEDDDYYADSDDDDWDPNEEAYEYEDWPGENADEREEAYDNFDWDSLD